MFDHRFSNYIHFEIKHTRPENTEFFIEIDRPDLILIQNRKSKIPQSNDLFWLGKLSSFMYRFNPFEFLLSYRHSSSSTRHYD